MYTLPLLLAAALPTAELAPVPRSAEVSATDVRAAVGRALPYLEKSSADWRTERKCVTCHQVPFAIWALTDAKTRGFAVDAAKLDDLTAWAFAFCTTDVNKGERTGGFHLTSAFMILSQGGPAPRDDALKAYPLFETLFAKRQKEDGSWREGRQIKLADAPREADEVDTMWTLLAIKSLERLGDKLPAETRKALAVERDKGLAFLKPAKAGQRLDWLALRVLVAKEFDTPETARELVRELLDQQNADGGWGYVRGGVSYPHTTGECLYALGVVGVGATDAAVRRASKYLLASQRPDGSWAARSRELFNTKPALVRDVSVHWGTAWAALGLLQTLPTAARAADDDVAAKQVELKKGDTIIFFGDSLTELAGKEEPKKHVTKGYVRIARETLQEKHKDKGIEVDWVATGGHTVPDLLKRVEKDVIAKKPTIVVIQIGCNDARRIPKDTFKTGLEELIDKLQKEKIQVVLCSLTSVGEKHDGTNKDDPKLDEFAAVARAISKAKNVPLNDLRNAFVEHWKKNNPDNTGSGILTYDGNHFNDAGHKFVAEQMLKKFK